MNVERIIKIVLLGKLLFGSTPNPSRGSLSEAKGKGSINHENRSTNQTHQPIASEFHWKEYKLHIDLYKFYFGIALKTNAFLYAFIGVILVLYFDPTKQRVIFHLPEYERWQVQDAELPLFIPMLLGVILGLVFLWGAVLWYLIVRRIKSQKPKSSLNIKVIPHIWLLYVVLAIFGLIFLGFSLALALLIIYGKVQQR